MKEVIKNYGAAIVAAFTAAAVLGLIFSGALFRGRVAGMFHSYAMQEKAAGLGAASDGSTEAVRSRMDIDAGDIVSAVHLVCNEEIAANSLVKSLSGKSYSVRIRKVELCSGADAGKDITSSALADGGESVCFPKSGAYRVSMVITDAAGAYMNGTMYYAIEPAGPLLS